MENRRVCSISPLSDLKPYSIALVANPIYIAEKNKWHEVRAKWDTGATICVITRELANRLKLESQHSLEVSTFTGVSNFGFDVVAVSLKQNGLYINVLAGIVDAMPHADCELLIGMNLIVTGALHLGASPEYNEIWVEFEPLDPKWRSIP